MTATTQRKTSRKSAQAPAGPTPEERLVQGLIEVMEAGNISPWQREWRGSRRGQHRNLITGQPYRGGNPALLELQLAFRGSDLPLWAGFSQAKERGWFPKKGSKACTLIRPQLNRYGETDEQGQPVMDGNGEQKIKQWVSYKNVSIFNAIDLAGDGLEEAIAAAIGDTTETPEPERHELAESVLSNWVVEVNWSGDRAFYSPTADRITLPERQRFTSASGLYATWAHEAIHSTGHSDRLGRDGIVNFGGFGCDSYAKEELIAELGAFLLCNRLSIGSQMEQHASYLQSWISALKAQPKLLLQSLSAATKAAALVFPDPDTSAPADAGDTK